MGLQTKTKSAYMVQFNGDQSIVEADSMNEAIVAWKKSTAIVLGLSWNEVDDPESISLVSDNPVIR